MKFLPPEPEVELYEQGFDEPDILERKKAGTALSDLVNRIDDPIVIALDGKWGTGKSYFLKRWVGAHSLEHRERCTTVFFDAFAHDYLNDPLPALVSALAERLPQTKDKQIRKVKNAAFKLAKPLARIGLSLATFGANEALNELGDAIAGAVGDEAKSGLENFWVTEESRQAAMIDLRSEIGRLATPNDESGIGSSVVIVIDELDRCRPDYALEVLEVIKHFFSVPHLHFVLGVNLDALENSVRARYGEKIDAKSYLKKFINITLELPSVSGSEHPKTPATKSYLDYLIGEMGIPEHIGGPLRKQVEVISKSNSVSLREIGKIVSSVSLVSQDVLRQDRKPSEWIEVMNDLIIAKVVCPDLYPKFLNATISDDELVSYFGATERAIQQDIEDGEYNNDYDPAIFWRFYTWTFIVNNGVLNLSDPNLIKEIGGQFARAGIRREAASFPMKIHLMWLDTFNFLNP